jgi:hypothetical protein
MLTDTFSIIKILLAPGFSPVIEIQYGLKQPFQRFQFGNGMT